MKYYRKFFAALFVLTLMAAAFAEENPNPKVSPYTKAEIQEYDDLVKKAKDYESEENYFWAMKTYTDAVLKYPIIAVDAYEGYSKLMDQLRRTPGTENYKSDEEKAQAYIKIFNEAEKYIAENVKFDITYSNMHRLSAEDCESTWYVTEQPGIQVTCELDYYTQILMNFFACVLDGNEVKRLRSNGTLNTEFPLDTSFMEQYRENNYVVDGVHIAMDSGNYQRPVPFWLIPQKFSYVFDVTDLNGNVIVGSEYISKSEYISEHSQPIPYAVLVPGFYLLNTLPAKARKLYESNSMDFTIKVSKVTVPYGPNNMDRFTLDSSRYRVYRSQNDVPSIKTIYNIDSPYLSDLHIYSKKRYDLEQSKKTYEELPGLALLPDTVYGEMKWMKMLPALYVEPVTKELYREIMGVEAPSQITSDNKDQIFQNFTREYNKVRMKGEVLGFYTLYNGDDIFEAEQSFKIQRNYGYKNDDALFLMTKKAEEFPREKFQIHGWKPDYEKELMVKVPGGTVDFTVRKVQHHMEVKDFYVSKYRTTATDMNLAFSGQPDSTNPNGESVTFTEAVIYCNKLSERFGYRPCYSLNGTTDVSKWPQQHNLSSADLDVWKKVHCDFSADGFRLPTVDEGLYIYYSDSKVKHLCTERKQVNEGKPDKLGLYRTHDELYEWGWNSDKRKVSDAQNSSYNYILNIENGIRRTSMYRGEVDANNMTSSNCFRVVRSTAEEAERLTEMAEAEARSRSGTGTLPTPSKEDVSALLKEVEVKGGKFDLPKVQKQLFYKVFRPEVLKGATVDSFYMAATETTQQLYTLVMGENPSHEMALGDRKPVNSMSMIDICVFCNNLSELMGLEPCYSINDSTSYKDWNYDMHTDAAAIITCNYEANGYRLPTNTEWEYAANGGVFHGKGKNDWGKNASRTIVYGKNSVQDVASKKPNSLGIYDLFGNAWEACFEQIGASNDYVVVYSENMVNPRSLKLNSWYDHVLRGGDYNLNVSGNKVDVTTRGFAYGRKILSYNDSFRVVRRVVSSNVPGMDE